MIDGAILSVPIAAAVWLLLRLTPRRFLNATTRYAAWWAALLLVMYLLIPREHKVVRTPPSAAGAQPSVVELAQSTRIVVPIKASPISWIRWILTAWLVLSLLLLLRLAASYRWMRGRRTRAVEAPLELRDRAQDWLALRPGARLAVSEEILRPMAIGPWRPTILIPSRLLDGLDAEDLDQVILHEAAHLARRDDFWLLIQRVVEALLPLHPVVRWITRQIDLEREIACDDLVVETLRNPRSYARCLTRVVELSGNVRGSLAAATAVGDLSHLARRINMLLDKTGSTGTRLIKARLGAFVAMLILFGWMGERTPGLVSFAVAQVAQAAQAATPPVAPSSVPQPPAPAPAAAPKPQSEKPAPARVLDPDKDPETARLEYRLGWTAGYLHSAENIDPDEVPSAKQIEEANKELLRLHKSFDGTAAEQDAAIKALRDRLRSLVDELTSAWPIPPPPERHQ
jgi:beta-lactamase regulating signal transducer with metallopeptidase domain